MQKNKQPCKCARVILGINLPIIIISLIAILISYLICREITPVTAALYYRGSLEYIFASLAITVGGALLADVVSKEQQ